MTKEEVETTFANYPYCAYKQGLQDGMAYTWASFRREAAKDVLPAVLARKSSICTYGEVVREAITFADELIKQLREDEK